MSDTRTIGTTSTIIYPLQRVFAFTPYYFALDAPTLVVGAEYTITFNGVTIKRYLNSAKKDNVPLSGMLQSFFAGVELGNMQGVGGSYKNDASKLMQKAKNIVVIIGSETLTLTFDIIWGAIEIGKRETTELPIWMFAGLPLTITQTIGDKTVYGGREISAYGSDVSIYGINQTGGVAEVKTTANVVLKKYNVHFEPCVPANSIYLRWVDISGEYRYYLLSISANVNTSEYGASYNSYPLTLNPSPSTLPALVKNRKVYVEKKMNNSIIAGVMAANDDLTRHLESLNGSLLQWVYSIDGSTVIWTEVAVNGMTITRKTREGNRQIDFEIKLPEQYNQNL